MIACGSGPSRWILPSAGDYEMKANAGYWKLPVAIISNGNTVKNTEYSFLANALAAEGIWWPAFSRIFRPIHPDDEGRLTLRRPSRSV